MARRPRAAEPKPSAATLKAFNGGGSVGDAYLRADEIEGLVNGIPQLVELAQYMGVMDRPLMEWSRDEMLRFLATAIRSAVPLVAVSHLSRDFNDRMPF